MKKDENVTKETENTEIEKLAVEQPQKPGSFHFVSGTGKKLAADNALLTEVMKEPAERSGKTPAGQSKQDDFGGHPAHFEQIRPPQHCAGSQASGLGKDWLFEVWHYCAQAQCE